MRLFSEKAIKLELFEIILCLKKFRPYNEGDAGTVLYVPEEGRNIVVLFEYSTANMRGIYTWVDRSDFENLSL